MAPEAPPFPPTAEHIERTELSPCSLYLSGSLREVQKKRKKKKEDQNSTCDVQSGFGEGLPSCVFL